MSKRSIRMILMATIALISVLSSGYIYLKRRQEKQEMLLSATEDFVNTQIIEFAGGSFEPSKYAIADTDIVEVSSDLGQRYPVTVTDRDQLTGTAPQGAKIKQISMSKDGEVLYQGDLSGLADLLLENGEYDVEIYCDVSDKVQTTDGTVINLTGSEIYAFRLTLDIPSGFYLSRTEMIQGSAAAIIGTNITGEVSATAPGVLDEIHFTVDGKGNAQALLSSTFRCTPGDYECIVTWNGEETVLPFTITEGTYEKQYLTISSSTVSSTVGNDSAMADYNGMIAATNLIWTPERYYEDQFIMPVNGPITTQFGLYRYTNGSTSASRHVGIDIAEDEGVPVKAAASGVVVVSRWVGTTGYTVCIDHGYGVRSYYYHMSALTAGLGDFVEQGQEIGKVGMTGYANGPHVHFNIMVGDNSISPWPVLDGTSGIFDLKKTTGGTNNG
ncbi:MAG: M23 family metallopeptidase [Oscillospiraceae bacterium]|nr:M23 family metallopeptidase [Oscillospiraceae bacterium]